MTAFTPETRNKITITWRNAMKEKGTLLPASEQKLLEDPCLYMNSRRHVHPFGAAFI